MIEVKNLNKQFNEVPIFSDFNLTVEDGDFVILSGKSGKGKTTLLNMIGGLEPYDSGDILFDGKRIEKFKEWREIWGGTVSFVFQNFALVEGKSVLDNLKIVKKKYRSGLSAEEALAKVGLEDKMNQKVFQLSGGEQQRVALARLFFKTSKIILADEPTGSLDVENGKVVMDILKKMNDEGATIILVTHDENLKSEMTRARIIDL